jgi:hypothetical protein
MMIDIRRQLRGAERIRSWEKESGFLSQEKLFLPPGICPLLPKYVKYHKTKCLLAKDDSFFGDMMRKRPQISGFVCLTLFKQDIRELVQLFQNNLQDVEIILDDLLILDSSQLDQFDVAYQAKSLIARGYSPEGIRDDTKSQDERQFIELKKSEHGITLLLRWNKVGKAEPEVSVQTRKLLLRCQNRVHQFMVGVGGWVLLSLPLSLMPTFQLHHVDYILQILLLIGPGVLLMLAAFFLFTLIVRRLHMETLVFLLPGAMRATHVYGRREAVGRLVIALVLLMIFDGSLAAAFRLLWR